MTVIFECDRRFQPRPGYFKSRIMYRIWWGWFAIAWLRISLQEYANRRYNWKED